jgi:hypothetical protein
MASFRIVITDLLNDDLAPEREVLDGVADVEALNAGSEADLAGRVCPRRSSRVDWPVRVSMCSSTNRRCRAIRWWRHGAIRSMRPIIA